MHVKVYLRSPPDVLAPGISPDLKRNLPDVELPQGSTVGSLLDVLGVGKARPHVLVNKVRQLEDAGLADGDRVDLVLPLAGG